MIRLLCILLLALSALTFASPASAHMQVSPRAAPAHAANYPGERWANNPTVNELVQLSENYWRTRGVEPWMQQDPVTKEIVGPCAEHLILFVDDFPGENAIGKANAPGCVIWVRVDYVSWVQDHPTDRPSAWTVCELVMHEIGHTGGLEHSTNPLSPMYHTTPYEVPWDCRIWARDRAAAAKARRAQALTHRIGPRTPVRLSSTTPQPDPSPGSGATPVPAIVCGFKHGKTVYQDQYVTIWLIGPKYCEPGAKRRSLDSGPKRAAK